MVDCARMDKPTATAVDVAVAALEAESQRQLQLREDCFGDGDVSGAKAADDLALAYRVSATYLRRNRLRWACQPRNG